MEQISVNQAKRSDFVQMLPENLKRDLIRTMRPHSGDVEAHGALHAVEVVVEAGGRVHEQGRGDAL